MFTQGNQYRVSVIEGRLQVEMDNDYACWAGIGHFMMAESWAVDYIDLDKGLMGLQLALDVNGIMVVGDGIRYALLRFPNMPESDTQ